ncbi:kinase-like domain-containing protein [Nemania abortiva]|nr:kinase-like domain-containing protein [Nemania abortiva]
MAAETHEDSVDYAHTDADSDSHTDAGSDCHTDADTDCHTDADTDRHTDAESECDTDADSGCDVDPYTIVPFDSDFLRTWATSVRHGLTDGDNDDAKGKEKATPVECTDVLDPLSGSYNFVFPLQFSDGVRWALKVPQDAAREGFDAADAEDLTTEALTLRCLKKHTTIPVPEVHQFHAGMDNSLKYPYILTDFIDGIPLPKVWFDSSTPSDVLHSRRMRALQGIAEAMVQLSKFTYPLGGSPQFDSEGRLSGVGPMRELDMAASLKNQRAGDDSDVCCTLGPFTSAMPCLLAFLDRQEPPEDDFVNGTNMLLRLFIGWLSELEGFDSQEFVLAHPDPDIQNILVTEEGEVCGIIDWQGVSVDPDCLGSLCYPSFLTRDWDPMCYRYDPNDEDVKEDSPEELQSFRAAYRDMVEKLLSSEGRKSSPWTRRSLMIQNLKIAADNPIATVHIVKCIFGEIKKSREEPLEVDGEELHFYEIACDLADDCVDEDAIEVIKDRFLHLCNSCS